MRSVDIILVKYQAPEYEKACISSILKHTDIPYSLTIYENYPNNINLGTLWNRLITNSQSEYICLLNSDTLVEDKWLSKLLEVFKDYKDAGVVGPVTNNSGLNGQEMEKSATYEVFDYREKHSMGTICGFCVVFPKKVWQEVGGFPEDFGFYGQDDAFMAKVSKHGYKQYVRKDVFIWHKGGASAELAQKRGEMDKERELKKGRSNRDAFFERIRKNV